MDGVRQRHLDSSDVSKDGKVGQDDTVVSAQKISFPEDHSIASAKKEKNKQFLVPAEVGRTTDDEGKKQLEQRVEEETLWTIGFEVFLPFIVAGLGMATTGITLNRVKVSRGFQNCKFNCNIVSLCVKQLSK